jgi:hypothetical protein
MEVVAWMIAIFDLLALLLVLVGLILFLARVNTARLVGVFVVAFLAPAAKEVGFVLPLVVTVWWALGIRPDQPGKRSLVAAWAGAGAAALLRITVFGGIGGYSGVDISRQLVERAPMLPKVALSAVFAPVNASLGWTSLVLTVLSACAVLLAAFGLRARDDIHPAKRLAAAGGTLAFISLLPALPYLNENVVWNHSRFMALPATGVVLMVSALLAAGAGFRRFALWSVLVVWSVATVFNLIPWIQGAQAREVIFDGIESVTREPGVHTIWLDGPIGGFSGNHLFGGHLPHALKVRLPDRMIDSDSRFLQRLEGRPQRPPQEWRGTLYEMRFYRKPLRLAVVATRPQEVPVAAQ